MRCAARDLAGRAQFKPVEKADWQSLGSKKRLGTGKQRAGTKPLLEQACLLPRVGLSDGCARYTTNRSGTYCSLASSTKIPFLSPSIAVYCADDPWPVSHLQKLLLLRSLSSVLPELLCLFVATSSPEDPSSRQTCSRNGTVHLEARRASTNITPSLYN